MKPTETKEPPVVPIVARPKDEREKAVMNLRASDLDKEIKAKGGRRGLAPLALASLRSVLSGDTPVPSKKHWDTPLEIREAGKGKS